MRAFTEGLPEGHIAADISDAAAASDAVAQVRHSKPRCSAAIKARAGQG